MIQKIAVFIRRLPGVRELYAGPRERLGRKAEEYVAESLRCEGYRILKRNYSIRAGEIDIIALREGVVAFVEVRSRTGDTGVSPQESVDHAKQRRIIAAARSFSAAHRLGQGQVMPRFDVAGVVFDGRGRIEAMEYFEDAFRPV